MDLSLSVKRDRDEGSGDLISPKAARVDTISSIFGDVNIFAPLFPGGSESDVSSDENLSLLEVGTGTGNESDVSECMLHSKRK